eukprot:12740046-Heterocapsa_arctica.AAC.1
MASELGRYGALLRHGIADDVQVDGVDAPEVVIRYGNCDAVPVIARPVVTHDDTRRGRPPYRLGSHRARLLAR